MRLTLVQPPNGYLDHYDLAPPLGLLSLAAAVREDGAEAELVDLNLRGMTDPSLFGEDFYDRATAIISGTQPDVVGLTSMALESHVCLELARRLKREDPGVVTVLGGPHFSAIAPEVLELYPWVDHVITGEGELPLRDLLRRLRGADPGSAMLNVAYRANGGVELTRAAKSLASMDSLPFPAYDLVRLEDYFALNPLRLLNFDSGRGCIFRCSFCYSPGHWGQGEQVKTATRVAGEMRRCYEMGARHLFFVQDNLANSAAGTKELCRALNEAGTPMTWNGYATMQRLVPDLLDPLAEAGCTELFVGVDAISRQSQLSFAKHFFKGWPALRERLADCLARGIVPTCAFMIDVPDGSDHEDTDNALLTALLARNLGCGIRLNTLTVYNATGTAAETAGALRQYTDLKPRLLLDTPPVIHDNPFARERPALFPFHSTILPLDIYQRFVAAMHVAYTLFTAYPRTLLRHAVDDQASLWNLAAGVADRVGDLTAVDVRWRRELERSAFREMFPGLPASRGAQDAFELESTELRISLAPGPDWVQVRAGDTGGRYRVTPYEVVRLHVPLTDLDSDDQTAPAGSPPGHYVVSREGGELRYCLVDDAMVPELHRVRQSAADGGDVQLSAGALTELTTAGLMRPADTLEEV
jgi:hypothetical protein